MRKTEHKHVHRKKKKRWGVEKIKLHWGLQSVSSRCHRWRKSTVTPSGAAQPSVGEGIKRLARLHFHISLFSPAHIFRYTVSQLIKPLTGTFFQLPPHEWTLSSQHLSCPTLIRDRSHQHVPSFSQKGHLIKRVVAIYHRHLQQTRIPSESSLWHLCTLVTFNPQAGTC